MNLRASWASAMASWGLSSLGRCRVVQVQVQVPVGWGAVERVEGAPT